MVTALDFGNFGHVFCNTKNLFRCMRRDATIFFKIY